MLVNRAAGACLEEASLQGQKRALVAEPIVVKVRKTKPLPTIIVLNVYVPQSSVSDSEQYDNGSSSEPLDTACVTFLVDGGTYSTAF